MGYYQWPAYVSVAERRRKAEQAAAKAVKAGEKFTPIAPYRGAIAKTFWGKAWCDNLERYSDYANRLPRGRTYVRNGSVIDLNIAGGEVRAQVMGSSLYKVTVSVAAVPAPQWKKISADCASSINSLVELLQGKLSKAVMERICMPGTGLFPAPKEIKFSCSCPDSASMCKHIAAVLYGIGARLDALPELLFNLRQVDAKNLVAQAGAGLPKTGKAPARSKVLDDALLADVFGIELDEVTPPVKAVKKTAAKKVVAKEAVAQEAVVKEPVVKKTVLKKALTKAAAVKKAVSKVTAVKQEVIKAAVAKAVPKKVTKPSVAATAKPAAPKKAAVPRKRAGRLDDPVA